jgi:hypothetical protein
VRPDGRFSRPGVAWVPAPLWLSRSPGWQSSASQSRVRVLNRMARAWAVLQDGQVDHADADPLARAELQPIPGRQSVRPSGSTLRTPGQEGAARNLQPDRTGSGIGRAGDGFPAAGSSLWRLLVSAEGDLLAHGKTPRVGMYVNQALSPVLVALRKHRSLMPQRRRITIRRQSGGGICTFHDHVAVDHVAGTTF